MLPEQHLNNEIALLKHNNSVNLGAFIKIIANLRKAGKTNMAINKATLAKEIDGVIEYIYPKSSADIIVYDETHSVSAMIQKLINGKVDVDEGKGLSQNNFTNAYKDKLDGIDENATKVIVDDALSTKSTNAVQNAVVAGKFTTYDRMLGPSSDIKDKADGTVAGNINALYDALEDIDVSQQVAQALQPVNDSINTLNQKVGDINNIPEIGDKTLSDVIAEINSKISTNDQAIGNLGKNTTEAIVNLNKIKEPNHNAIAYTLQASKWDGAKYSLEDEYPSSTYTIYMDRGVSPTSDQTSALTEANIGSNLESNVFICNGVVPKIDIPVILEVVKRTEDAGVSA